MELENMIRQKREQLAVKEQELAEKRCKEREQALETIEDIFARGLKSGLNSRYLAGDALAVLELANEYHIDLPHERIRECLDNVDYQFFKGRAGITVIKEHSLIANAYEKLGETSKADYCRTESQSNSDIWNVSAL